MRKILLSILLIPALLASCSSDDNNAPFEPGKGHIRLDVNKGGTTTTSTRADFDYNDFTVTLDGPDGPIVMDWPQDGLITNIEPGSYTVMLESHPDGIPAPAFDSPAYKGVSGEVTVASGQTAIAKVVCSQLNGGVFFSYAAGLENIVPTVTHPDGTLLYPDMTTEVGYFAPEDVTVTMEINGVPAKINGEASMPLAITAAHHWKINVRGKSTSPTGDITVNVTFEEVGIGEVSWGVSEGDEELPEPSKYYNTCHLYYYQERESDDAGYYMIQLLSSVSAMKNEFLFLSVWGEKADSKENLSMPTGKFTIDPDDTRVPGTANVGKVLNLAQYSFDGTYSMVVDMGMPQEGLIFDEGYIHITDNGDGTYSIVTDISGTDSFRGDPMPLNEGKYGFEGPSLYDFVPAANEQYKDMEFISVSDCKVMTYNSISDMIFITLVNADESANVRIKGYTTKSSSPWVLDSGTYNFDASVPATMEPLTMTPGSYSPAYGAENTYLIINYDDDSFTAITLRDGTMEVSNDGSGNYTITFNMTGLNERTRKNAEFTGTYTGALTFTEV